MLNKISIKILKKKYFNKKYLSWINDKNNQKFTEVRKIYSLTDLKKYFEDKKKGKIFGIFYNNTNHIGNINIKTVSKKKCYVGFLVGEKKFRSKGVASKAVELAIRKCFYYYNFELIYSNSDIKNFASVKVLKNNNFLALNKNPNLFEDNKPSRILQHYLLSKKRYENYRKGFIKKKNVIKN